MSEEDAALFWEIGNNPVPDPEGSSVGPALTDRAIPITEGAAPGTMVSPRLVPSGGAGWPSVHRCVCQARWRQPGH